MKSSLILVLAVMVLAAASTCTMASYVLVDDMSDVSDWFRSDPYGSIHSTMTSDGDIATLTTDLTGLSYTPGWDKTVNIDMNVYPRIQVLYRKPQSMANEQIYTWVQIKTSTESWIYWSWLEATTSWQNGLDWAWDPGWGAPPTIVQVSLHPGAVNLTPGAAAEVQYDFVLFSGADDERYMNDPIPEPSSLMALACGVVGVIGMLRRRA